MIPAIHVSSILQTKLHPPLHASGLMRRPRLLTRLDQGQTCTLTLVVAPAGSGKTSLVSQWLEERALRAAWLQLDANDGEPSVLFTYIVHAMRRVIPGFGNETQILLQSARMPPLSVVSHTLSNDISYLGLDAPLLLILDDYHMVQNPDIDRALADLMARPPRGFRVLVMSRQAPSWPLGKLRIENRLCEVGASDLRFTPEETAAYLRLNGVTALDDRATRRLQKHTEGWATGLQLAVLALRQNIDTQDMLARTGAFVGSDNRYLLEYMVDEALAVLSESILHFMVTTSICPRFCVPLCQALTGSNRASVKEALRFLEEANLFLIPLEDSARPAAGDHFIWYRYHHLMEEILVSRLQESTDAGAISELHQRAAAWLGEEGYVDEALDHLVAIPDWDAAERLLMSELSELLDREDRRTVDRWLSCFPKAEIMQRPGLLLMQSWSCFFNLDIAGLAHTVDRIRELTEGADPDRHASLWLSALVDGRQEFDGQVMLLQATVAYFSGMVDATIATIQKALALLSKSSAWVFYTANYFLTNALQHAGRGDEAEEMLLQAYRSEQPKPTQASARLLFALAAVRLFSGKYTAAYEAADLLLRETRASNLALMEGWAHDILGRIDYERNRLDAAAVHFAALTERCYAIHRSCAYDGFAGSMLIAAVQDRKGTIAQIEDAWRSFEEALWGLPGPLYYSARARAALLTGDVDAPRQWAAAFTAPLPSAPMIWLESSHVTKIRCLLAAGSAQGLTDAGSLADQCLDQAERTHNAPALVTLLAMRALLFESAGDHKAAIELLTRGVRLTAAEGFVRTYVDLGPRMADLLRFVDEPGLEGYIASTLAAFPTATPTSTSSVEPAPRTLPQLMASPAAALTQRELEVLALLATPMTSEEIAQTLSVSYSTVRQHTSHIYEKLGVNKRRHAVLMAAELGLLK